MKVHIHAKRPSLGEVILLAAGLSLTAEWVWIQASAGNLPDLAARYRSDINSFIVVFAALWFALAAAKMLHEASDMDKEESRQGSGAHDRR